MFCTVNEWTDVFRGFQRKNESQIPDCDLMIFKGNISCYILLLKYPLTLENTKFIAGEIALKVSLVLYIPTGHYEPW